MNYPISLCIFFLGGWGGFFFFFLVPVPLKNIIVFFFFHYWYVYFLLLYNDCSGVAPHAAVILTIYAYSRIRLVHVFKNWKLLFENIYENTCRWRCVWECVKCCLKTENGYLKTQIKLPWASFMSVHVGSWCFNDKNIKLFKFKEKNIKLFNSRFDQN